MDEVGGNAIYDNWTACLRSVSCLLGPESCSFRSVLIKREWHTLSKALEKSITSVRLVAFFHVLGDLVHEPQQLTLAAPTFEEVMLFWADDVVLLGAQSSWWSSPQYVPWFCGEHLWVRWDGSFSACTFRLLDDGADMGGSPVAGYSAGTDGCLVKQAGWRQGLSLRPTHQGSWGWCHQGQVLCWGPSSSQVFWHLLPKCRWSHRGGLPSGCWGLFSVRSPELSRGTSC